MVVIVWNSVTNSNMCVIVKNRVFWRGRWNWIYLSADGWVGNGMAWGARTRRKNESKQEITRRTRSRWWRKAGVGCLLSDRKSVCLVFLLNKQNNQTNRLVGSGKTFASLCQESSTEKEVIFNVPCSIQAKRQNFRFPLSFEAGI